jgi:hypothetical protein
MSIFSAIEPGATSTTTTNVPPIEISCCLAALSVEVLTIKHEAKSRVNNPIPKQK